MVEQTGQGLLDLTVELSNRDVTAGDEFTIFLLVKNPFTKPAWIRRVHVSLPSELMLAVSRRSSNEEITAKNQASRNPEKERGEWTNKLDEWQEQLSKIATQTNNLNSEEAMFLIKKIEKGIKSLNDDLEHRSKVVVTVQDASVGNIKVGAKRAVVDIQTKDGSNTTSAGNIEVIDSDLALEEFARTKRVELESSLPSNAALQSGNTAVYSVVLKARRSILFTPSKYRLQFSVNYSFDPETSSGSQHSNYYESDLFTNTISYELSIRASVYSLIFGSVIGGSIGGIGRILQVSQPSQILNESNLIALVVAIILSIVAIIFMGRKSDTQSFLSVEDFWGGLLIGFLVGYTGTSFFQDLTGINNPKI